jgi:hypothetical protein
MGTNTKSITDYLQTLSDIIPAIQMGIVPPDIGIVYHKFAENDNIGSTQKIISTCENTDPFNSGAELFISSTDDADTQVVVLDGVNQDFVPVQETITLQGTTPVALATRYRTIYRGYNANGVQFSGDVSVVDAADNEYANLPGTYDGKLVNQTLTSIFTVPVGYTGFVTEWQGMVDEGKSVDLIAYIRLFNGVWRYQDRMTLSNGTHKKGLPYSPFPEKSDLKVMARTAQTSTNASVSYTITLINNNYINKFRRLAWR